MNNTEGRINDTQPAYTREQEGTKWKDLIYDAWRLPCLPRTEAAFSFVKHHRCASEDAHRRGLSGRPWPHRQIFAAELAGTLVFILDLHTGTEPDLVATPAFAETSAEVVDPSITPPVNTVLTPPAYMYLVGVFWLLSTNTQFSSSTLGDIDCKESANKEWEEWEEVADDGGDTSEVDGEQDEGRDEGHESVSEAESESELESGKVIAWTQFMNEGT